MSYEEQEYLLTLSNASAMRYERRDESSLARAIDILSKKRSSQANHCPSIVYGSWFMMVCKESNMLIVIERVCG